MTITGGSFLVICQCHCSEKQNEYFLLEELYVFVFVFTVATSRHFAQQRKTDTIFMEEKILNVS